MFTVRVVKKALLYQFNPINRTFTPKGACFKAEGSEVNVEHVPNNPGFVKVCENGKPTTIYLRSEDVAEVATV